MEKQIKLFKSAKYIIFIHSQIFFAEILLNNILTLILFISDFRQRVYTAMW